MPQSVIASLPNYNRSEGISLRGTVRMSFLFRAPQTASDRLRKNRRNAGNVERNHQSASHSAARFPSLETGMVCRRKTNGAAIRGRHFDNP
jgi:hypothetical protein